MVRGNLTFSKQIQLNAASSHFPHFRTDRAVGAQCYCYECLIIFMIELCYISMTYMYINVRTNLNAFISIFDEKLRREERRRAQLL